MRLQREVSLGMGAIIALQILLSILAIGLLTRMGPAIERILQENVYSGEAVEEMLSLLASSSKGTPPKAFKKALTRARSNVTEKAERPLLKTIRKYYEAAFKGDSLARIKVISALRDLGQVNRHSMTRADHQAKRMGYAGAWAFAMLGALALALGIMVYRRLRQRLEQPIQEVLSTTQRIRTGNLHARCPSNEWPQEVKQIASDLNWLLDRWLHSTHKQEIDDTEQREAEIRRALAWILNQEPMPSVLIDESGRRILMSHDAIDLDIPSDGIIPCEDDLAWKYTKIPDTSLRIIRFVGPIVPPRDITRQAPLLPPAETPEPVEPEPTPSTPDNDEHDDNNDAQDTPTDTPAHAKPKPKQKRKRKRKKKK